MKTSIENTGGLSRRINITVPPEVVSSNFDRVYKEIQRNATLKGFRKGKAPMNMIKSMYADRAHQSVITDLVETGYSKALSEHKLDPISEPSIKVDGHLKEEQGFSFTAELEVRPEIKFKKTEGLQIEREKMEVKVEAIEKMIQNILDRDPAYVPVFDDRGLTTGDVAEIDFVGYQGETAFPGGAANDHKLEIGSGQFIPGFEEGLLGMKAGTERDVQVTFPADYHETSLAGSPVRFHVTLKKIMKKDKPTLNDEFVKNKFGTLSTVDDLKAEVRKELEESKKKQIDDQSKTELMKALVKENPVEVPATLRAQQVQALEQDATEKLKKDGFNAQQIQEYKEKWQKEFEETAEFMIQSNFLVLELGKQINGFATDKDVTDKINKYAAQTGLPVDRIAAFYLQDKERMSRIRYQILEERVVEHLLKTAKITEVAGKE
jgi:trigger factor